MEDVEPDPHAGLVERARLTPLHRITIEHLERSRDETVPVSLFTRVEAASLLSVLEQLRRDPATPRMTVTVLLAKLLADTLAEHPQVNAVLDGEDIVRHRDVQLGVAVAAGEHLVVPVLRDVETLSVMEIAEQLAALRERAAARKLGLADVRGGVFTLSSIGMFLDDVVGTPIIPPGQAGVLLVGGVYEAPVVRDGRVVPGVLLPLSLTVDHRIVNGAAVSRFFADLRDRVRRVDLGAGMGRARPDGEREGSTDG